METALANIANRMGAEAAEYWRGRLEQVREMAGVRSKFEAIAAARDREEIEDHLAELQFALFFAGLSFSVELKPMGVEGPDLRVFLGEDTSFYVEVMHLRHVCANAAEDNKSRAGLVVPVSPDDQPSGAKEAYEKILAALDQVGEGESLVAFWNNDRSVDSAQVEQILRGLRRDAAEHHIKLPHGLSFVLYGTGWVSQGGQQLHCFPLHA